ncbi:MAG: recombinase family protein [Synergistaceae bacterium]|nr:recombinase family protein [Synergistaceae bacterium]
MLVFQVLSFRKAGKTHKQIADLFNEEGTHTASGRGKWSPTSIQQLLSR